MHTLAPLIAEIPGPTTLLTILLLLATTALAAYIIYTLALHPLSPHPGPLLARLSQLPDLYHAYHGTKHTHFAHLHAQYGPVVRFSPNCLSIAHPAALKALHAPRSNVRKGDFYKTFRVHENATSTLLATDPAEHRRKRRVVSLAFGEAEVRAAEEGVQGVVDGLVAGLRAEMVGRGRSGEGKGEKGECGRSEDDAEEEEDDRFALVDISKWSKWAIFDIMGQLVFGKSFATLPPAADERSRRAIFLLGRAARRNYAIAAMPCLARWGLERWLPGLRGLWSDRQDYLAFGKRAVEERKAAAAAEGAGDEDGESSSKRRRRDIFSFLLRARDPETGEGMPESELWMEGNTLIVAGSDTTSTTLSATLHHLLSHPRALARLQTSLRTLFRTREALTWTNPLLQTHPYLRAVLDESLRLSPAVPGLLPRRVLAGGLAIPELGIVLPEGVDVGVPIWAVQREEAWVAEPAEWVPERWLGEGDEACVDADAHGTEDATSAQRTAAAVQSREALLSVWNPFSMGARACLGKPLVYMELSLAVARLVWEFDLRLAEVDGKGRRQGSGEFQIKDWFLSWNEGLWVEIRERKWERER